MYVAGSFTEFCTTHCISYRSSHAITAVDCHPQRLCIATSNSLGEIQLWYGGYCTVIVLYCVYHKWCMERVYVHVHFWCILPYNILTGMTLHDQIQKWCRQHFTGMLMQWEMSASLLMVSLVCMYSALICDNWSCSSWHHHALTCIDTYKYTYPLNVHAYTCMHTTAYIYVCTHTGSYLLSGGEESVLVLWQLDSHKKQFRPRLGSPISKLACCHGDGYFAISLQSNGRFTHTRAHTHTHTHTHTHMLVSIVIYLLSGLDTEVEHIVGGLRKAYLQNLSQSGLKIGLVWCPCTKLVLLNSTPGLLQFYDTSTDSVVREVCDSPCNQALSVCVCVWTIVGGGVACVSVKVLQIWEKGPFHTKRYDCDDFQAINAQRH